MDTLGDPKMPLTADNVRSLARANFPDAFDQLRSAAPESKWLKFDVRDDRSIGKDRAVFRHLKRSEHNHLLVVGSYSPGSANEEDSSDRVAAHVHADPAEVRFYRLLEHKDGSRSLEDVNSTSAVDFDSPFCDVGDGQGDHRAGHRVTALIEWFFLDAGRIKELARPETDPSKFTRNFRQACYWVGNAGKPPSELFTRRPSSATVAVEEKDLIPVRPKRSSTISFNYQSTSSSEIRSPPPIKRAATDTAQAKRFREEEMVARPTKHRRTLSEQVPPPLDLSRIKQASTPNSPRTPTLYDSQRMSQARGERIVHLHTQYLKLKTSLHASESKQQELQEELTRAKNALTAAEARSEKMEAELKSLKAEFAKALGESTKLMAEMEGGGCEVPEKKTRGRP